MMRRNVLVKALVVLVGLFLLSAPTAHAQLCKGDFNCDGMVTPAELGQFAVDFGRQDCPVCPPCEGCQAFISENMDDICTGYSCDPPAPVEKTGQTISYDDYDDGWYERGVAWPNPRFTDNLDGTVTDNLTGLIWLKDANCATFGAPENWSDALSDSNGLASGSCGLTDGSSSGEWRLPNLFELESLRDMKYHTPCISDTSGTGKWSAGDPFTNVQSAFYWSSTTFAVTSDVAWDVDMYDGDVGADLKSNSYYVWPVRGGRCDSCPGPPGSLCIIHTDCQSGVCSGGFCQ